MLVQSLKHYKKENLNKILKKIHFADCLKQTYVTLREKCPNTDQKNLYLATFRVV